MLRGMCSGGEGGFLAGNKNMGACLGATLPRSKWQRRAVLGVCLCQTQSIVGSAVAGIWEILSRGWCEQACE